MRKTRVDLRFLYPALLLAGGCLDFGGGSSDDEDEDEAVELDATATRESNTCGDGAVDAPASLERTVSLTVDGHDVTWEDGYLEAEGDLEDDEVTFAVEANEEVDMRDEGDTTSPKCVVVRTDTIEGALDAATDPTALDATWRIEYAPTDDSDCDDLVGSSFDALPCSVRYDIDAEASD